MSQHASPAYVVRKEVRSLSRREATRFHAALLEMMRNTSGGPETSEYFRIAGYHGWPNDYCAHRQEIFPAWHRAYLKEFETALQRADVRLGGDGNIGLPYWDWTETSGREVFPAILRSGDLARMPEDLLAPKSRGDEAYSLYRDGWSRILSDRRVRRVLRAADMKTQQDKCLSVEEHWKHASTRW